MIQVTVNTPKGEVEYNNIKGDVYHVSGSIETLHPDWTSMVMTITKDPIKRRGQ